ncbi:hypothetical protein [Arthrospira platensis]
MSDAPYGTHRIIIGATHLNQLSGFDDNSRCLVRQKSIIRALMIILGV